MGDRERLGVLGVCIDQDAQAGLPRLLEIREEADSRGTGYLPCAAAPLATCGTAAAILRMASEVLRPVASS